MDAAHIVYTAFRLYLHVHVGRDTHQHSQRLIEPSVRSPRAPPSERHPFRVRAARPVTPARAARPVVRAGAISSPMMTLPVPLPCR